jgi:hypothetical protein
MLRPALCTAFVALLIAGCASAKPRPVLERGAEAPPGIITSNTGAEVRLESEARAIEGLVNAPMDSVFRRLSPVWQAFRIPIKQADPRTGTLKSDRFRAPAGMTSWPMHENFDCGYAAAGPRADLWDLYLDITTAMRATPEGTRVSTMITASARPRDGTGTQPVPCASMGKLERNIVQRLQAGAHP